MQAVLPPAHLQCKICQQIEMYSLHRYLNSSALRLWLFSEAWSKWPSLANQLSYCLQLQNAALFLIHVNTEHRRITVLCTSILCCKTFLFSLTSSLCLYSNVSEFLICHVTKIHRCFINLGEKSKPSIY